MKLTLKHAMLRKYQARVELLNAEKNLDHALVDALTEELTNLEKTLVNE